MNEYHCRQRKWCALNEVCKEPQQTRHVLLLSPCRNAQVCWTPGPNRGKSHLFACMGLVESRVTLDKPFDDVPKCKSALWPSIPFLEYRFAYICSLMLNLQARLSPDRKCAGSVPRLRRVLEVYKDRDLDFCVDASVLSLLLGLDALKSTQIVGAFTDSPSSQEYVHTGFDFS